MNGTTASTSPSKPWAWLPDVKMATMVEGRVDGTNKKKNKKKPQDKAGASAPGGSEPFSTTLADELEWCIRQLELGMSRPKVSIEQKRDSEKLVNRLKSPKTPLPRKRQLMRATFGDYRSKMRVEPLSSLPLVGSKEIKIENASKAQDGHFYRRSRSDTGNQATTFTFDFQIESGGISRE